MVSPHEKVTIKSKLARVEKIKRPSFSKKKKEEEKLKVRQSLQVNKTKKLKLEI